MDEKKNSCSLFIFAFVFVFLVKLFFVRELARWLRIVCYFSSLCHFSRFITIYQTTLTLQFLVSFLFFVSFFFFILSFTFKKKQTRNPHISESFDMERSRKRYRFVALHFLRFGRTHFCRYLSISNEYTSIRYLMFVRYSKINCYQDESRKASFL